MNGKNKGMKLSEVAQKTPVIFVLGSTGCGKSLAAIQVAKTLKSHCGYERVVIVNCDVMQFHEGLPIATNKVSSLEMDDVTHLFIGFLDSNGRKVCSPTIPYVGCDNVKQQNAHATDLSDNIESAYNIHSYVQDFVEFANTFSAESSSGAIVVCGGTGYYAQALMFDNILTVEDEKDEENSMLGSASSFDSDERDVDLWQKLNSIDSVIATHYHPNDRRRIQRLLEIHGKTGRLPSEIYAARAKPLFRFFPQNSFVFWIQSKYEELKLSLDTRVDRMVDRGIVEDFCDFLQRNRVEDIHGSLTEAIGFKELFPAFEIKNGVPHMKGDKELKAAIEDIKRNTRRYARQQVQWIRNRFLGHLREVFLLQQGTENFISIDASAPVSHFLEAVVGATKFCLTNSILNEYIDKRLSFPLRIDKKPLLPVKQDWCEICETVLCGRDQKSVHLKSKRHRGALRHAALVKEQQEKYGRVIPPKKRRLN